jgi:hypothetical protein
MKFQNFTQIPFATICSQTMTFFVISYTQKVLVKNPLETKHHFVNKHKQLYPTRTQNIFKRWYTLIYVSNTIFSYINIHDI